MSIERIRSLIAQDMGRVDTVIREKLHSEVVLIRQVSEYIINSGGKRLRPALPFYTAKHLAYLSVLHFQGNGLRVHMGKCIEHAEHSQDTCEFHNQ